MKIMVMLIVMLLGMSTFMLVGADSNVPETDFQASLQMVVKRYKMKEDAPETILAAAHYAEGDPVENYNEAERYAAGLGVCRDFSIMLNNGLASGNESASNTSGYEDYLLEDVESITYNPSYIPKEVMEARASEDIRAVTQPSFWTDERFLDKYGMDMASFVPSAPYAGICLLTVSKDAYGYPGQHYNEDEKAMEFLLYHMKKKVSISLSRKLSEKGFYLTGNPDTASIFLESDIAYSQTSSYSGSAVRDYDGYVIVFRLNAIDALTHKKIATIEVKGLPEYRVKKTKENYINYMIWTDFPKFTQDRLGNELKEFTRFMDALAKYCASDLKAENTIPGPYSALPEWLKTQSSKSKEPWEKAIYESGAKEICVHDGSLSFRIQSYNPRISDISEEDPAAFLTAVSDNAAQYDHVVTVQLEKGKITSKVKKAMETEMKKTAAESKKAYGDKVLLQNLRTVYFPAPTGKTKKPDQLAAAAKEMPTSAFYYPYKDPAAAAIRFSRIQTCSLVTKNGPLQLALSVTGLSKKTMILPLPLSDLAEGGFGEAYQAFLPE